MCLCHPCCDFPSSMQWAMKHPRVQACTQKERCCPWRSCGLAGELSPHTHCLKTAALPLYCFLLWGTLAMGKHNHDQL